MPLLVKLLSCGLEEAEGFACAACYKLAIGADNRAPLVRLGCTTPMIALLSSTEFYIELTAARAFAELALDGAPLFFWR